MISKNETFKADGRIFRHRDIENQWEVEFEANEVPLVRALNKLQVDVELCSSIEIVKTTDNKFYAVWQERHPELGTFDEHFARAKRGFPGLEYVNRTNKRVKGWAARVRRMPYKHFAKKLTRSEAFQIVGWFWLPQEFHSCVGL